MKLSINENMQPSLIPGQSVLCIWSSEWKMTTSNNINEPRSYILEFPDRSSKKQNRVQIWEVETNINKHICFNNHVSSQTKEQNFTLWKLEHDLFQYMNRNLDGPPTIIPLPKEAKQNFKGDTTNLTFVLNDPRLIFVLNDPTRLTFVLNDPTRLTFVLNDPTRLTFVSNNPTKVIFLV